MDDYQRAEEELKYAVYLDPQFTQAYSDLGLLYFEKGNFDESIEQWEKILEVEPNISEKYVIFTNLGMVYKMKEMPNKALKYFLQALQIAPEGSPIILEIEKKIYDIYRSDFNN